jgi:hypothetical protein
MKVVRVSSYDDEGPGGDQYVVPGTVGLTEVEAEARASALNDDPKCPDANFYVVRPDDYVPWKFEP